MEQLSCEQIKEEQTENAKNNALSVGDADISLGKFKDVKSLLNAYNSLESEFTKRCQRIKELEGKFAPDKTEVPSADKGAEAINDKDKIDEKVKIADETEILKEYLKNVMASKQKAVVIDEAGVGLKTPVFKPKTIAEAGLLAKEIL